MSSSFLGNIFGSGSKLHVEQVEDLERVLNEDEKRLDVAFQGWVALLDMDPISAGKKKTAGKWASLYAVLVSPGVLMYFSKPDHFASLKNAIKKGKAALMKKSRKYLKGSIAINKFTQLRKDEESKEHICFIEEFRGQSGGSQGATGHRYRLKCMDGGTLDKWIKCLEYCQFYYGDEDSEEEVSDEEISSAAIQQLTAGFSGRTRTVPTGDGADKAAEATLPEPSVPVRSFDPESHRARLTAKKMRQQLATLESQALRQLARFAEMSVHRFNPSLSMPDPLTRRFRYFTWRWANSGAVRVVQSGFRVDSASDTVAVQHEITANHALEYARQLDQLLTLVAQPGPSGSTEVPLPSPVDSEADAGAGVDKYAALRKHVQAVLTKLEQKHDTDVQAGDSADPPKVEDTEADGAEASGNGRDDTRWQLTFTMSWEPEIPLAHGDPSSFQLSSDRVLKRTANVKRSSRMSKTNASAFLKKSPTNVQGPQLTSPSSSEEQQTGGGDSNAESKKPKYAPRSSLLCPSPEGRPRLFRVAFSDFQMIYLGDKQATDDTETATEERVHQRCLVLPLCVPARHIIVTDRGSFVRVMDIEPHTRYTTWMTVYDHLGLDFRGTDPRVNQLLGESAQLFRALDTVFIQDVHLMWAGCVSLWTQVLHHRQHYSKQDAKALPASPTMKGVGSGTGSSSATRTGTDSDTPRSGGMSGSGGNDHTILLDSKNEFISEAGDELVQIRSSEDDSKDASNLYGATDTQTSNTNVLKLRPTFLSKLYGTIAPSQVPTSNGRQRFLSRLPSTQSGSGSEGGRLVETGMLRRQSYSANRDYMNTHKRGRESHGERGQGHVDPPFGSSAEISSQFVHDMRPSVHLQYTSASQKLPQSSLRMISELYDMLLSKFRQIGLFAVPDEAGGDDASTMALQRSFSGRASSGGDPSSMKLVIESSGQRVTYDAIMEDWESPGLSYDGVGSMDQSGAPLSLVPPNMSRKQELKLLHLHNSIHPRVVSVTKSTCTQVRIGTRYHAVNNFVESRRWVLLWEEEGETQNVAGDGEGGEGPGWLSAVYDRLMFQRAEMDTLGNTYRKSLESI